MKSKSDLISWLVGIRNAKKVKKFASEKPKKYVKSNFAKKNT